MRRDEGQSLLAVAVLLVVIGILLMLLTPKPAGGRCLEDRPCFDCTTMGNGRCGP